MNEEQHTGGCLCGSVRYALSGPSLWNVYCHCETCRKLTGAPVTAFVRYAPDRVQWTTGERQRYASSPGRLRGFCRDCGSSLTWETEVDGEPWLVLHVSSLDDPENFAPTEHVFLDDALPWFEIDDDLERHSGSKYI